MRKKLFDRIGLIACAAVILGAFFANFVYNKYAFLGFLDTQLKETKLETRELEELSLRLQAIDSRAANSFSFSEMLYILVSALPAKTRLSLLEVDGEKGFSLKGYTPDIANVFTITSHLNNSDIFEEVRIEYASQLPQKEATIEFYIQGQRARR